jgi:Spy/CpxP family protein refolding chaperone
MPNRSRVVASARCHQLGSFGVALLTLLVIGDHLAAQPTPQPPGRGRGAMPRRLADRADSPERRFEQRLDSIVMQRLALSEEQRVRVREVASRTEKSRRQLRLEEIDVRLAMRREMLAGDKADEARVAQLLDAIPQLERRRVDLLDQEQRELATVLSPIQRARYFALQDELRRGLQELQRRRLGARDDREPPGSPAARRDGRRPPP